MTGPVALAYRFGQPRPWRWVIAGMGPDSGAVLSDDFATEGEARRFGAARGWRVGRSLFDPVPDAAPVAEENLSSDSGLLIKA